MKIRISLNSAPIVCAALTTMLWPYTLIGQTNIHFIDRNLEQAVRYELQKPDGDLTSADLLRLTSLYAPNYRITDLSGLEAASNLTVLNVTQNDITNVAALASLPQLASLDLSYNYVHDLSSILGLTNLTSLFLGANGLETVPLLYRRA
jgi:Leucine-rich repeat (LRR) protein